MFWLRQSVSHLQKRILQISDNLKYPTCSREYKSDVNSFIDELNLRTAYNNVDTARKANLLPTLLTGKAQLGFSQLSIFQGNLMKNFVKN